MKNIAEINSEINQIQATTKNSYDTDAKYNKAIKRLGFLKMCKMYLEDKNTTSEFIEQEIKKLTHRVSAIDDNYIAPESKNYDFLKEHKKNYMKLMDVSTVKTEITALKFLSK